MRSRKISLLLIALAACSEPPELASESTKTTVPTSADHALSESLVIRSNILFETEPTAPHLLEVSYRGADFCRWSLSRLNDEDADRLIEYRSHQRAFGLPQDQVISVEYNQEQSHQIFARMALRRLVFADDPNAAAWTERALAGGLGSIQREVTDAGHLAYTSLNQAGQPGETLTVLERWTIGTQSWPKKLRLNLQQTVIWTETVEHVQTQNWLTDDYFVPPDRSTSLSPR